MLVYTLSDPTVLVIDLMHYGEVDLEPEYQRDVVWTEARQEALIDSLFHNYYIPPVLFALRVEEDGTEKRTCSMIHILPISSPNSKLNTCSRFIVDGKQRLTAIALFMSGLVSCIGIGQDDLRELNFP
jgi:uncharacterized protein with ParB-like and HNH nuclease domain